MSLGDASSRVASFSEAPSLDSPSTENHGTIQLHVIFFLILHLICSLAYKICWSETYFLYQQTDDDYSYRFEDFLGFEYPINMDGEELLAIEEEEYLENGEEHGEADRCLNVFFFKHLSTLCFIFFSFFALTSFLYF